jgi:hypothetical protein
VGNLRPVGDPLDEAAAEFVRAHRAFLQSIRGRVPIYVEGWLVTLGDDVVSAVEWLKSFNEQAVFAVRQYGARVREGGDVVLPSGSTRRAASSIKAFYLFLRAYHDAICAVLVARDSANRPGMYTSMNEHCLKEGSRLRMLLDDFVPSYADEFSAMRERRNRIKRGFAHDKLTNPESGVGIAFTYLSEDGQQVRLSERITFSTIVDDFRSTTRLLRGLLPKV